MKLGVNPLCWMNSDFPSIDNQVSVEQCLTEISEIGYRGVELEDPFIKVLDHLPEWLSTNRLSCIGKWHSTFILENGIEQELHRLHKHIDLLESLNADVVILSECSGAIQQQKEVPLSLCPRTKNRQILCDGLEKMAQLITNRGLISAYHHHMGTVVQTKKEIDILMNETENLGLLFDSGHLAFAQADPLEVLQEHIPRITHVHCKNVRTTVLYEKLRNNSSFYSAVIDGVFTVPGDGEGINFPKIISTLFENNYSGWVVMEAEQDPSKSDPYTFAQLGYQTLSSLLQGVRA